MKSLISKIEPRESGYRVAQVINDGKDFPVSTDMFWVDCDDNVKADQFWYDPVDQTIKQIPVPETT
jgi:hypothetical protein